MIVMCPNRGHLKMPLVYLTTFQMLSLTVLGSDGAGPQIKMALLSQA